GAAKGPGMEGGEPLDPSEAPEDYRCAICLDNISNMACVDPCFHRFCSGCIQRWATMRAVCPLCRQPIDRVLHTVRSSKSPSDFLSFDTNTETAFP
uniref:RING-type E3 ubiquitin transferase n=1 Tax=Phasianus colchicus TaxID=9054 RepID=A0A669QJY9_PHACC